MRPSVRRAATLLALPPLLLAGLVATSPATAQAPVTDPTPVAAGAAWLQAQLTDGVVHNDQYKFDDLGLTADVAFALAAVGDHDAAVHEVVAAIAPRAEDEWYSYTDGAVTTLYAGSLAKATVLAQVSGADPTDFGGQDLVERLEGAVSTDPPTTGRLLDENNSFGDANVVGQGYAVRALHTAGSQSAVSATDYLLDQQCSEGWFRLELAERDAADQTCDGDSDAVADVDATALSVLALLDQAADPDVADALDAAAAWLLTQQRPSGAFGGGPTTEAPNTNSAGLAGWALASLGETSAAMTAAAWVRAHQAANVARCSVFRDADVGAVAYDDAARSVLLGGRITRKNQDQFRRATAQAVPVLAWAARAGDPEVLSAPGYVKAGSVTQVGVVGAAPGEALCAWVPRAGSSLAWADREGEGRLRLRAPKGTGTARAQVAHAHGSIGTAEISTLAGTRLRVGVKRDRIAAGRTQVLTVRGLAPGEQASVSVAWPTRGSSGSGDAAGGQANGRGVLRVSMTVPRRPGTATVKAVGQFRNRSGTTTFVVTR